MEKVNLTSLTQPALVAYIQQLGQPAFRGRQIFKWLHQKQVTRFEQMTDSSKALIAQLDACAVIETLTIAKKQVSRDGTVKYLFRLPDGNCIESVIMRYEYGNTICVSTEVGCAMGCRFCASTQGGLVRRLTAGEICAEVYTAQQDIGARISNIVLMGIGEPLDNYDSVLDFLRIISSPDGINIGMRNISLSTCGLVPRIERLAQEEMPLTLSVSLHAPNNALRSSMMPVNDTYPIEQLISACRAYQNKTGRRISFEYAMVNGVNDTPECATQLAHLLRGMSAHINLIPINPVDGSNYSASDAKNINQFKERLIALGMNATVRRRLGTDISAACGQLRQEAKGENNQ